MSSFPLRRAAACAACLVLWSWPAVAQPAPARAPISYTVRFSTPQHNYVDVEARLPTDGRSALDVMMAVWTPGSYLIREYERHVESVAASAGGRPAGVEKTAKNRWRITAGGAREVVLTYRVFAHEMSVRTNWVDADYALLNGAPTFITIVEEGPRPHDVRIELPAGWKTSVSPLPGAPGGAPNHYRADSYDVLVDSPLVAGNPAVHQFTIDGKPHVLVNVGEAGVFDGRRAARDLEAIVQAQRRLWGSLPYDKYVFFNLLTGTGSGGLEHRNSTVLIASRWAMGTRSQYRSWLSLASHEFFHAWNVKRLRPIELGPFDYEREVYPRSLWVAEGITDYYADLHLVRGKLISALEYLNELSTAIRTLQTTPGRLSQTVEMASFDSWIKYYRPDENSVNSAISYYTKGAVLGFVLDAAIRAATRDAKSLDDVMRLAHDRYSGARGFTPQQFRDTASEVAGVDLGAWFTRALETTEEIDYKPALDWLGLQFRAAPAATDPSAWLGARTRVDGGRLIVASVPRATPAYEAGVNPGDEIVGIDGFRVAADGLEARLESYRPGQKVSLLVARRDELKRLDVTLGLEPDDTWALEVRPDATAEQRAHLAKWLQ